MVKHDSSLQSPMAARFTPLQSTLGIVHGDLRLVCGCSAMETHFMNLPMNILPMLFPEAVCNSVVSVATEDKIFVRVSALRGPVL